MPALWIVAPVYNEEESLRAFVAEWLPVFRAAVGDDFVFCLINDGSTDRSPEIMEELARLHPQVRLVHKANSGHGQSCLHGYRLGVAAGAEWLFQIDSDGQCDPSHFHEFWQARDSGPVHYGERKGREDGWARRLISRVLSAVIFLASLTWVRDANVPYRLMSRAALCSVLDTIPARFGLANVLLALLHAEDPGIVWHRVRFRPRAGRRSPVRPRFFARGAFRFLLDYFSWVFSLAGNRFSEFAARLARPVIALAATSYLLAFPVLALLRVGVFTEYDWLESVHMVQVHRVLAGLPLYGEPTLNYTPLLYGPLYVYVAAASAFAFGEHFALLRLVSLSASIGTVIVLWRLVRSMGGSPGAAWLAAGLYAGMYGVVGFSYDTARVDALCLFLTMVCAWAVWNCRNGGRTIVVAALAASAAVLTKQTALVPVAFLALWSFVQGGTQGRRVSLACLAAVLAGQAVLAAGTEGRALYYLYQLPLAHHLEPSNAKRFIIKEFLPVLGTGFAVALWGAFTRFRVPTERRGALFSLGLLAALTVAGLLPRLKVGGSINNLMPLAAGLSLCCGLSSDLWRAKKGWVATVVLVLLAAFTLQIHYKPEKALRLTGRTEVLARKRQLLGSLDGIVFAPCDPYLALLAGKNESAFWGAMLDVWMTPGERGERSRRELLTALAEQRFDAVVLRERFFKKDLFPVKELEAYYAPVRVIGASDRNPGGSSAVILYRPRRACSAVR